jgi:protocatechuate 3,4-dioxygenase beta subunit
MASSAARIRNTRRYFLKNLSAAASGLAVIARPSSWFVFSQNPTPQQKLDEGPADATWKAILVTPAEPGEPLIVRGVIYTSDGHTPIAGARLYVYHTDARGYYNDNHNFADPPRIRGWMKTNFLGQYEFRTVKPAPYPGGTNPAHIHPTADGPGYPARWLDEYWFAGDPYLKRESLEKNAALGLFSQILTLQRDPDGVLVGIRNFRLA